MRLRVEAIEYTRNPTGMMNSKEFVVLTVLKSIEGNDCFNFFIS